MLSPKRKGLKGELVGRARGDALTLTWIHEAKTTVRPWWQGGATGLKWENVYTIRFMKGSERKKVTAISPSLGGAKARKPAFDIAFNSTMIFELRKTEHGKIVYVQ